MKIDEDIAKVLESKNEGLMLKFNRYTGTDETVLANLEKLDKVISKLGLFASCRNASHEDGVASIVFSSPSFAHIYPEIKVYPDGSIKTLIEWNHWASPEEISRLRRDLEKIDEIVKAI